MIRISEIFSRRGCDGGNVSSAASTRTVPFLNVILRQPRAAR